MMMRIFAKQTHAREPWPDKSPKTDHKDVTCYKGLLKQYTEELLETMAEDFSEDPD